MWVRLADQTSSTRETKTQTKSRTARPGGGGEGVLGTWTGEGEEGSSDRDEAREVLVVTIQINHSIDAVIEGKDPPSPCVAEATSYSCRLSLPWSLHLV